MLIKKMITKSTSKIPVWKISDHDRKLEEDMLAVEEPLEIQIKYGSVNNRLQKSISITMRTPGNDVELAVGFLFTEGIIQSADQIQKVGHVPFSQENVICVEITPGIDLDLQKLERHFYTSSSCGVCGKSSIDALKMSHSPEIPEIKPMVEEQLLHRLPAILRQQQSVFEDTGGLHAAALFDTKGQLIELREDVGRHNAVDKLVGVVFQKGMAPLNDYLIMVSGRASFELIQKSLVAGIPILAAVGAPSSLAIALAKEWEMTVVGFLRDARYNIYCGEERISRRVRIV